MCTDYVRTGQSSLTFPGMETRTILVSIVDDMVFEGDESFTIVLSNPQPAGAEIGIGTITITITDNEEQCKYLHLQCVYVIAIVIWVYERVSACTDLLTFLSL